MTQRAARLGCIAIAAVALGACAGATRLPVPDEAVVHLDDAAAAAVVEGGSVKVLVARPGTSSPSPITSGAASAGVASVRLMSYGGETGEVYNTFVYGMAPAGAASVSLSWPVDALGGHVWDGAWLIVLKDKDVLPEQLHWQFKAADGSVVAAGDGILNP